MRSVRRRSANRLLCWHCWQSCTSARTNPARPPPRRLWHSLSGHCNARLDWTSLRQRCACCSLWPVRLRHQLPLAPSARPSIARSSGSQSATSHRPIIGIRRCLCLGTHSPTGTRSPSRPYVCARTSRSSSTLADGRVAIWRSSPGCGSRRSHRASSAVSPVPNAPDEDTAEAAMGCLARSCLRAVTHRRALSQVCP